jgi:hypothetical protein
MNFNTEDDELFELNSSSFNKNNIKGFKGADLLFNKNKISPDLASLSSMSSMSSSSSNGNRNRNKNRNNNNSNKYINNSDDEDDDDDDEDDDDDNDDNNNDDDDDEDEDGDDESGSMIHKSDNKYSMKDELNEKREILYQLDRLREKGYKIPFTFTMENSLSEMKNEYNKIVRDKEIDASVRFQRKMIMAFVTGVEYLNTRYDPFAIKLNGWSEQVHDNINDYDDIFEELHEKYKSKGKKMAPELRLFISLTGSAFMFHLTSRMFKESAVPDVEEVLKSNPELMKQFQNAAAKQYINGNFKQSSSQSIPMQSQQSQSQQPSIFGMVSNLFSGLNNSTPNINQNQNQSFKSNDKPMNDINNIINNVHSKISLSPDDDNRIETMSVSDEEITSIIEDTADIKILKTNGRKKMNGRTLNI